MILTRRAHDAEMVRCPRCFSDVITIMASSKGLIVGFCAECGDDIFAVDADPSFYEMCRELNKRKDNK